MFTLTSRHQFFIGMTLVMLMIATRGHHFGSLEHLPGASWAVFLLAGFYLRPAWVFPGCLALAASLDYAAITWGGVSSFCISVSYVMLLPAYGALWLAGRWAARHYRFQWRALLPLSAATLIGAALCELISSGSFYFFSGRFVDTTFAEFGARLIKYFPGSLQALLFYVAIAAITHIAITLVRNTTAKQRSTVE